MKVVLLIPVAAGLLLAGCSQSSNSTSQTATNSAQASSAADSATTPNVGGVLGQVQNFSQQHIDLAQISQAVQQFAAVEGRYPKDLQELVPHYLAKVPPAPPGYKINYDPASGKVEVVQQ